MSEEAEIEEVETPVEDVDLLTDEAEEESEESGESEESEETVEETEDSKEAEEKEGEEKTHPFDRPTIAQIKAKFPDLFKTFPQLQDVYFREREYTKLFPTVDDAKEAAENNTAFVNIQEDVMKGNGEQFFEALKETDTKALGRFADTLMATLSRVDKTAFLRAANPVVEDICRQMYAKGKRENNENISNSAEFVAEYFFGDAKYATGDKTSVAPKPAAAETEVATERTQFERERYDVALRDVSTSAMKSLMGLIDNEKLDPSGTLSPFIRKTIIDNVLKDIGEAVVGDKAHMRYMDTLWANAKRGGYRDLSRIESAYLARAKGLVSALRAKYVSEATGRKMKTAQADKTKIQNIQSRKDVTASGSASRSGGSGGKVDYRKSSDMDILNDKISYK